MRAALLGCLCHVKQASQGTRALRRGRRAARAKRDEPLGDPLIKLDWGLAVHSNVSLNHPGAIHSAHKRNGLHRSGQCRQQPACGRCRAPCQPLCCGSSSRSRLQARHRARRCGAHLPPGGAPPAARRSPGARRLTDASLLLLFLPLPLTSHACASQFAANALQVVAGRVEQEDIPLGTKAPDFEVGGYRVQINAQACGALGEPAPSARPHADAAPSRAAPVPPARSCPSR